MSRRQHLRLVESLLFRQSRRHSWTCQWRSISSFVCTHQGMEFIKQHPNRHLGRHQVVFFSASPELPPQDDESMATTFVPSSKSHDEADSFNEFNERSISSTSAASSTVPKSEKRKNSLKKDKSMITPAPQLLQLRELLSRDFIKQQVEELALRTELSKLKLLIKLKNKLTIAKGKKSENTNASTYWELTQNFLESQESLPNHVKTTFWKMIIAPTSSQDPRKKVSSKPVTPKQIEILIKARETAVHRPIFWNDKHKHRVLKQLVQDKKQQKSAVPEYQTIRSQQLTKIHGAKSAEGVEDEAKQMAIKLCSSLPPSHYKKLLNTLQDYANEFLVAGSEQPVSSVKKRNKYRIHEIYSFAIHACAKEHTHHIAASIVEFLYLTVGPENEETSSEITASTDIISFDSKVDSKADDWRDTIDKLVDAFEIIQTILLEEHDKTTALGTKESHDAMINENDEEHHLLEAEETQAIDWCCNGDQELNEEMDNEGVGDDEVVYDDSEESVTATFLQVASLKPGDKANKKQFVRPRSYTTFEAMSIGRLVNAHQVKNETSTEMEESSRVLAPFENAAPSDRLIFIDNLPIDISENRLKEAYSRCGPIDEIHIFHQRPDLDPGRQSDDCKKKIRKASSARSWWERPRTPLYATILYHNSDGARKATVDPLRIFGMVLDKHLIRSHHASAMSKLYLENIPEKHDITSIEAKLSQILHPSLYVCLDIEQRRQKVNRGPSSCVIKFPDFDSAHWAFSKLSANLSFMDEDKDCELHWMPTPRDALLYWTRQLNF